MLKYNGKCVGITPAYAGKSNCCYGENCTDQDHPRLCGEKLYPVLLEMEGLGSPPPMRGKVCVAPKLDQADRITPAYAGKSTPIGM